jgi:hypothetical protein
MKPKFDKNLNNFNIFIIYLEYSDMAKKASHATVPLKRTHCKKRLAVFPFPVGMSLTKLPGQE